MFVSCNARIKVGMVTGKQERSTKNNRRYFSLGWYKNLNHSRSSPMITLFTAQCVENRVADDFLQGSLNTVNQTSVDDVKKSQNHSCPDTRTTLKGKI